MIENEVNDENTSLVAWRLGRVEKAVEKVEENNTNQNKALMDKLDSFGEIKEQVVKNTINIDSLLTSRSRMIAMVSVLATGVFILLVERLIL